MENYVWFTGSLVVQRSVPDEKEVKAIVAQLRQAEKLLVRKNRTRENMFSYCFIRNSLSTKRNRRRQQFAKRMTVRPRVNTPRRYYYQTSLIHTAVISSEELVKYAHQLSLAGITTPPTGWDPSRRKKKTQIIKQYNYYGNVT